MFVEVAELHLSQAEHDLPQAGAVLDLTLQDALAPADEHHTTYSLDLGTETRQDFWNEYNNTNLFKF